MEDKEGTLHYLNIELNMYPVYYCNIIYLKIIMQCNIIYDKILTKTEFNVGTHSEKKMRI